MNETHLVSTNSSDVSGGLNTDAAIAKAGKRSSKYRPLSAIFLGCFVSDKLKDGVSTLHQTKSAESITVTSECNTESCASPLESTAFSESLDKCKRERRFSLSRSLQSLRKKQTPEKLEAKSNDNEKVYDDEYGFISPLRDKLYISLEEDQSCNRDVSHLSLSSETPAVTSITDLSLPQKRNEIHSVNTDYNSKIVLDNLSQINHEHINGLKTVPVELEVCVAHVPRLRQQKISRTRKQRPRSLGDLDKKITKRWSVGISPAVDVYYYNGEKVDKAYKRKSLDVSRSRQRRSFLPSPTTEEGGHNHYTPWLPYRTAITRATSFISNFHHGLSSAFEEKNSDEGSIYRRGARRWRKLYKVNGHIFQAKRFNRRASCEFCKDRIWGLGRQGFKCTQCKLLVHKKCHKLQKVPCSADLDTSTDTLASHDSSTLTRIGTNGRMPVSEFMGDVPDPGITEETPVEMPSSTGSSSEPMTPAGQAGQYCLDDFELIRVIGRGSYAKVLMVELKKTNRIYAMKVIKKTLVTDDEDIDWVQTEKHVFETASNHPFLVGLHSCFQTPSRLFFVIEFVRGGDLMFHMQRQRRLPEEHARFYAAEICLALNFLHEKGIIYRDLKLDNVLLDHEGHIKLTDYGMCKEGIRPGDTTSTFCGTPNYIAPEILQGVEYSFSVDWWALGVLLYEMLAGKSPFDIVGASDNPDCNTEDFLFQVILERPIRIPRSLSVKAASILKGFLNKNPVDRLGCHPETGFTDIVTHPFFKTIDWEMLEQRQVPPPYRPRLDSERDLANFPPEFTDEPIQLTPDDQRAIENIDQSEFEGFEYVNPLLMSMEDCV